MTFVSLWIQSWTTKADDDDDDDDDDDEEHVLGVSHHGQTRSRSVGAQRSNWTNLGARALPVIAR